MRKELGVFVALLFAMINVYGQQINLKFGKSGHEKVISHKQNCFLDNFGTSGGFTMFKLLIENTDRNNPLTISNITKSDTDSRISIFVLNTSSTIHFGTPLELFIYYSGSNNISECSETLSFVTNDLKKPQINLQFSANSDKGKLEIISSDYPILGDKIDLGNVVVGSIKSNTFNLRNNGKGYIYVGETENIITKNKLTSDYKKKQLIAPGSSFNNNISFTALKKGPISSSFTHRLEHGQISKKTIQIVGTVVAPVASLKYKGSFVTNNSEINLPVNNYEESMFTLAVENTGDYKLNMGSISLKNDINSEFYIASSDKSNIINPGETKNIHIKFSPNKIGDKRIKFIANSNGYESEKIEIYINVKVKAAVLTFLDDQGKEYKYSDIYSLGTSISGAKIQKKLILKNTGNKNLIINQLKELVDYSFLKIKNTPSLNLKPGEITQVQLEYTPSVYRRPEERATLKIVSNNQKDHDINFSLKIKNSYALIKMSSDIGEQDSGTLYDFLATSLNSPKTRTFTITNNGNRDLNISTIEILDDKSNYYSINSMPAKRKLAPGESDLIKIQFAPQKEGGQYYAKLKLTSSDYLKSTYILNLKGWAITPKAQLSYVTTNHRIDNNSIVNNGTFFHTRKYKIRYQIKNGGTEKLKVSQFTIHAPEGVKASSDIDISGDYISNAFAEFVVTYEVSTPGEKLVDITFKTNDKVNENFKFTTKFMAEASILQLYCDKKLENNQTVDFESATTKSFVLKNRGNNAFYIHNVSIQDDIEGNFSVDVTTPFLRPNEEVGFKVSFNSESNGKKTAKLQVKTDDPLNPNFIVNLNAENTICSIEDFKSEITVYPNPFTDHFTIHSSYQGQCHLKLYDLSGVLVLDKLLTKNRSMIYPKLSDGIYILIVKTKDKFIRKKMIKISK